MYIIYIYCYYYYYVCFYSTTRPFFYNIVHMIMLCYIYNMNILHYLPAISNNCLSPLTHIPAKSHHDTKIKGVPIVMTRSSFHKLFFIAGGHASEWKTAHRGGQFHSSCHYINLHIYICMYMCVYVIVCIYIYIIICIILYCMYPMATQCNYGKLPCYHVNIG